jgi:hypothetical protein
LADALAYLLRRVFSVPHKEFAVPLGSVQLPFAAAMAAIGAQAGYHGL